MPMRIGVPPLGLSRRRLSLVDPAYSGSGPPVPTDRFEDDRNPPDPTIGSPEGSSKTDHFSTALKLLAPLLGLMAGGKKGLAYGTQFSTGFIDEQRKIRGEQETARERQSLASDRERRTQAEERRASLAEDKADAETWTWDSQNRVFASNKGNIKQPAQGMVTIPPEEAKGTYDGDRGVIVYQNKGEFKVLKGLPAKQFKPEGEPRARVSYQTLRSEAKGTYDGDRGVIVYQNKGEFKVLKGLPAKQFKPEGEPRARVSYQTLIIGDKPHKVKVSTDAQGNVISTEDLGETTGKALSAADQAKEDEINAGLYHDTNPADTTKAPGGTLVSRAAPIDTTGGRPSMTSRPTGASTVRPQGLTPQEEARLKELLALGQ